jgi:hypothetical protein
MKNLSAMFMFFLVTSAALGQSAQNAFNEQEAKKGWNQMASLIESCSGEIITYYEGLPDTKGRHIEAKEEFQKNDGGRCFKSTIWRHKSDSPSGEVVPYKIFCTNGENLFALRSTENGSSDTKEAEGPWRILEVRPSDMPLAENPVLLLERDARGRFMCASHTIKGIPLWELWEDANFSVKSIVLNSADASLVDISCHWVVPEALLPPKQKGGPSISPNVEITLTLNPNSYWRIERQLAIISVSENGKTTRMFASAYPEYKLSENDVPFVVKVSEYTSRDRYVEKEMPVYVGEMTYKSFAPSPEEDFHLPYYGFPEPDFGTKKTGWVRYIMTAIGTFLIIFALWSMYRSRKKGNGGQDEKK